MNKPKASQAIFWGGLIAGTLDITAASVASWLRANVSPVRVFQSVASGLLGPSSYTGGPKTAALGLVLHFFIAATATALFYFASRKLAFMIERPVISGLFYGVLVYLFMNFIVLPLSKFPPPRTAPALSGRMIGLLIIMFFIGLPIALIVRRFAK
jgi:hypothetical protein